MKSIGLDIGTTTICAVLYDTESYKIINTYTYENKSTINTVQNAWEKTQDVEYILSKCKKVVEKFLAKHQDIVSIGVTGQMHGIIYIDKDGNAVSPLYTWQDGRGNLEFDNHKSYSQYLAEVTNYKVATGYGSVTHFYNIKNTIVCEEAVCFCTIADFIAMKLSNKTKPILHKSMAASLGLFDLEKGEFDKKVIEKVGMDFSFFPKIAKNETAFGNYNKNIIVSLALGDNQASFLGSVGTESDCLINIGTGSQISIYTSKMDKGKNIEYRPYINDTYLMVGAPLCGGDSYALLKKFYKKIWAASGIDSNINEYDIMNQWAETVFNEENKLIVNTQFNGTREKPFARGQISNIDFHNFTPEFLTYGILQGICNELLDIFLKCKKENNNTIIIGSGNGIRKNKALQKIIENSFDAKLVIRNWNEEAACGMALYALYKKGIYENLEEIQQLIEKN